MGGVASHEPRTGYEIKETKSKLQQVRRWEDGRED